MGNITATSTSTTSDGLYDVYIETLCELGEWERAKAVARAVDEACHFLRLLMHALPDQWR